MRTEDVPLNIKQIFDRKKAKYDKYDVVQMRHLCKQFIDFILECERRR